MLNFVILTALFAAFIMLLLSKWGYFEKFRMKFGKEPCYFCHSFWINVIVVLVCCIIKSFAFEMAIVPLLATPLTWFIAVK